MDRAIERDLANYISRQCYYLRDDLAFRTRNWLRRKHKVKVSTEEVSKLVHHYYEMYTAIRHLLPRFIKPSTTGFAELKFVDYAQLKQTVFETFPKEDREVLKIVIGWVIYYKYLR